MKLLVVIAAIAFLVDVSYVDALMCYVGGSLSMDDSHSLVTCPPGSEYCIRVDVHNSDIPFSFMSCQDYDNTTATGDARRVPCEADGSSYEYVDAAANIVGTRHCCKGNYCNGPHLTFPYVLSGAFAFVGLVGLAIVVDLGVFGLFMMRQRRLQKASPPETSRHSGSTTRPSSKKTISLELPRRRSNVDS